MTDVAIFLTDLGWFGLCGSDGRMSALVMGHVSAEEVRRDVRARQLADGPESDWYPDLRLRLQQYARGVPVNFGDLDLPLGALTAFQKRVVQATRDVEYGGTRTYAEIATAAGSPKAARAVGQVMASNRFPIVVPCHRIVASGGGLGGFSAPHGIALKERLLHLEAENVRG